MRAMRASGLRAAAAAILSLTVALAACSSPKSKSGAQVVSAPDAGPDAAAAPAALGPVLAKQASLPFGLYFTPTPKMDPKDALAKSCASQAKAFTRVDSIPALFGATGMAMWASRNPADDALEPDFVAFAAVDLSPAQIAALPKSEPGASLTFVAPAAEHWRLVRAAYELMDCLADATGGVVYDESTRQLFALASFRQRRLGEWKDGHSALAAHYVTHVYPDGDFLRLVTLGLDRFGLPELVLNQALRSDGDRAEALVRLVAMALEQPGVQVAGGVVDIDLDAPWVAPVANAAALGAGATRKARFHLVPGKHEPGDAEDRLWEISFDGFPGADLHERQSAAFKQLFGIVDRTMLAKHNDDALIAARDAARARLPAVKKRFNAGLGPGERLLVKAPFAVTGKEVGTEYMWLEVVSWKGTEIRGVLANEPEHIPDLHQGVAVKVEQKELYDYALWHADGTYEGDETTKILEQQERGE
jgi:uncharacterized protein YegJ (DUF2314 family)